MNLNISSQIFWNTDKTIRTRNYIEIISDHKYMTRNVRKFKYFEVNENIATVCKEVYVSI